MIRCIPKAIFSASVRLCGAALLGMSLVPMASAEAPDPPAQNLCCGVPSGDEAPADHMVGRWRVTESRPGVPMRQGEQVTFRRDGTMAGSSGTCRYTMLRGELTVSCPSGTRQGTLEFLDDDKAVWHLDGERAVTIEVVE